MKSIAPRVTITIQPLQSRDALFSAASQLLETELLGKSFHQIADECLEALEATCDYDPQAPPVAPPPEEVPSPALSCCGSSSLDESDWDMVSSSGDRMDLNKLGHMVQQNEKALNGVEGKDGVCLLGGTGAGKSTFVHHLAGENLVLRDYRSPSGLESKVYEPDHGRTLPGFVLGHSEHESGTSSITQWLNPRTGRLYIDLPGNFDTRGHEINIATSMGLQKAAERFRSVRFVVFLRCDLFGGADKSQTLRGISRIVGSVVTDFKYHSDAFTFLFSHVSKLSIFAE
jgi:hypothetical protein